MQASVASRAATFFRTTGNEPIRRRPPPSLPLEDHESPVSRRKLPSRNLNILLLPDETRRSAPLLPCRDPPAICVGESLTAERCGRAPVHVRGPRITFDIVSRGREGVAGAGTDPPIRPQVSLPRLPAFKKNPVRAQRCASSRRIRCNRRALPSTCHRARYERLICCLTVEINRRASSTRFDASSRRRSAEAS